MRTARTCSGDQPRGALPPDQGAARRSLRFGAAGPRRRHPQYHQRRRDQPVPAMGRLRRQQGRSPPPEPNLGCRAGGRRGAGPRPRPRRHGYGTARDGTSGCRSRELEAPGNRCPGAGRRDCRGAPEQRSARRPPGLSPRVRTMIAESRPLQRPPEARLLTIDAAGRMRQVPRADFVTMQRSGDLVIANDAATLPASLHGTHVATGTAIEIRLPRSPSPTLADPRRFHAIVFGAGDYRQRTEDRSSPPVLHPGDRLALGPLSARIEALLGHPRLVALGFEEWPDAIWAGRASHGKPI